LDYIASTTRDDLHWRKGAITSKIKHAIKHKTSSARLAQLLQPDGAPSLAAS